ncbi:MAG: hypothetical protein LUG27_06995 [Clostridiales bacterium]|nr:hypothetical protein [Clostridiales bacterium]
MSASVRTAAMTSSVKSSPGMPCFALLETNARTRDTRADEPDDSWDMSDELKTELSGQAGLEI